jgi:hypothetical protein
MITLKRELVAIIYFFLFVLVVVMVAGLFFELVFWPLLAWLAGADGYNLPQLDRLYKWVKLIGLGVPPCTLILWIYDKKSSGR